MNRWTLRGAAGLAALTLTIAGCDQQQTDPLDDLDTSPTIDVTSPGTTDDPGTSPGATDDASPSPTGS